jgi:hypothetical protein
MDLTRVAQNATAVNIGRADMARMLLGFPQGSREARCVGIHVLDITSDPRDGTRAGGIGRYSFRGVRT